MHNVFNKSPKEETKQPISSSSGIVTETGKANSRSICDAWQPDDRDQIPRSFGQRFKEVAE